MNSPLTKTDILDLLGYNFLNACEEAVTWVQEQEEEFAEQIYLNCPNPYWWEYVLSALQTEEGNPLATDEFYDMSLFWKFVGNPNNDPKFLIDTAPAQKIMDDKLLKIGVGLVGLSDYHILCDEYNTAIKPALKARAERIKRLELLPPWNLIEESLIWFHDSVIDNEDTEEFYDGQK